MAIDLNDLVVFTRVIDEGSFTAGGRVLGLPKSTVSRRIARLEDRLGVRLLQRTTRRLSLTDAGRAYHARASRIIADLEEAERLVIGMQAVPTGRLRVTAPVEMGERLAELATVYLRDYPQTQVELDLTSRYVSLVEEGYDLAIRAGRLGDSTLIARRLARSPRFLYASPEYLAARGAPLRIEELRDHDCILLGVAVSGTWHLTGPRGQVAVPVSGRIAVTNFQGVKRAAAAGLGIALLPATLAEPEASEGRLSVVLPLATPPADNLWAVYPSTRHLAPKVRAFIDLLEAELVPELERLGRGS